MRGPWPDSPGRSRIISTLLAAARTVPAGRVALDDGQQQIAYGELEAVVADEGGWLEASGGERFATLADNGVGWALTDLALHARNAFHVPLPGYFTPAQLLHVLDDAGVDTVLTDDLSRLRPLLSGWRTAGMSGRSGFAMFRRQVDPAGRSRVPPGTCKVTYTSGSTAAPQGVCLSAPQLERVAASLAGATSGLGIERHLCLLPLATLLENVAGIYAPLLVGATALLPPSSVTGMSYAGPDVARMLQAVSKSRPGSLVLVPELLQLIVTAAERGWVVPPDLRFVAVGGASVSASLLHRAETAGLPVFEGYGLSECASVVCLNTPAAHRPGSVGRPLPHAQVRVGPDGEIRVSGVTMLGRLGDEPRSPDTEYATGDLGEIDADGFVYVRGRARNVFITSFGRNVSPEWVEREIAQQPGIRHVMVCGEARPYAVALVSAHRPGVDDAAIERAIATANATLPEYAQVRRWLRVSEPFTFEDGLLTSNGRLRRSEIAGRYRSLLDSLYREAPVS